MASELCEETSEERSKKPLLDLPFPLEIVKAWGDNVPPESLSLQDVLDVTKVCFLTQIASLLWFCTVQPDIQYL